MCKELERNTSYCKKEILFRGKRAQESYMAAVLMDRKLKKLREENGHNWQMLANVSPTSSLSQVVLLLWLLHLQPMEAQKCQGIPWNISPSRNEEGQALRAQALETPAGLTAHSSQVLNTCNYGISVQVFFSNVISDLSLFGLATVI